MKAENTYFDEVSQDGLERSYEPKDVGDRLKIKVVVTGDNSQRVLDAMEKMDDAANEFTHDYEDLEGKKISEICDCGFDHHNSGDNEVE